MGQRVSSPRPRTLKKKVLERQEARRRAEKRRKIRRQVIGLIDDLNDPYFADTDTSYMSESEEGIDDEQDGDIQSAHNQMESAASDFIQDRHIRGNFLYFT